MTVVPTYSVQVAWSRKATGLFVIGTSVVGSTTDLIAGDFGIYDFDTLDGYVKSVSIDRGRSGDGAAFDAGTCRVALNDPFGVWNPANVWAAHNLVDDPSFEVATGLWNHNADVALLYYVPTRTTEKAYSGSYSMHLQAILGDYDYRCTITGWSEGDTITASAYLWGIARVRIGYYDGSSWSYENGNDTTGSSWQRSTATLTIPAGTTAVAIAIFTTELVCNVYIDAVMCKVEASASAYVDGDTSGYGWRGERGASHSGTGCLYGNLLPMRPLRVRATYGGTTYSLFYGFVTRIEHNPDPNAHETVIEATDLFLWLDRSMATISTKTSNTVSQLIGELLDASKWVGDSWRNLEAGGDTISSWSAAGDVSHLREIQDLLTTDLGLFFIAGDGRATYIARNTYLANGALDATYTDSMMGQLRPGVSVDGIVNSQTVTKTGGTAQTALNDESRGLYGYSYGTAIDSANLVDDTHAYNLAWFLVGLHGSPQEPVKRVRLVNSTADNLTQILSREIGDRVRLTETRTGSDVTGIIEQISHEIAGSSHAWQAVVRARAANVFTLDYSLLSGTDILAI